MNCCVIFYNWFYILPREWARLTWLRAALRGAPPVVRLRWFICLNIPMSSKTLSRSITLCFVTLSRHSSDKSAPELHNLHHSHNSFKHFTLRKHFATHDPTYVAKYSNKTPDHMGLVRQIWQTVLHDGVQSPASLCGGLCSIQWHKSGHQSSAGPEIAIKRLALKIVKFCLTIFTAFVLPNANALRLFT